VTEEKKEAFLHRWSRRKHEEKRAPAPQEDKPLPSLPPVEKLTPESDFTGFMHPKVEDALRRVALKKLFNDPHFNTPDPFEPFSGDWNVADPISDEMMATLNQARTHIFGDKKEEAKTEAAQTEEAQTEEAQTEEKTQAVAAQDPAPQNEQLAKTDESGKQDA
jgi:hypothetical protein